MGIDIRVTQAQLGWLAGIIDGEGTITIAGGGAKRFYPCVLLKNTSFKMIEEFERLSGILIGNEGCSFIRNGYTSVNPKHRSQKQWGISNFPAVKLCMTLLPFLVTKQEQAKLVCQFFLELAPGKKITREELRRRFYLSKRIRELNHSRFPLGEFEDAS